MTTNLKVMLWRVEMRKIFLVIIILMIMATLLSGCGTDCFLSVIAQPSDGGTVSGGGWYSQGEVVIVTEHPKPGRTFSHWEGDLSPNGDMAVVKMDQSKTVVAVFK